MAGDKVRQGGIAKPGRQPGELRKFGLVMAAAFAVLAALLLWRQRPAWPYVAGVAGLFAASGLIAPRMLAPVEKAWMTLAGWLSVVMTYVVLTLAFFLLVTPMGLIRRLVKRDPLKLRFDKTATTYWVPVEPDGPASRPDRPY